MKEEEEEREEKEKKKREEKEENERRRDNSYFKQRFENLHEKKKGRGEAYLRDNGFFTSTHAPPLPKRKRRNDEKNGETKVENHFDDEALHEAIETNALRGVGEVTELPPDGSHGVRFHRKNFSLWQHRADTMRVHVHGLKSRGWFL